MSRGFDTVSENLRLLQIYSTLGNFAAESIVDGTVLAAPRRRMQKWVYALPEPVPDYSMAQRTRVLLEGLGPTYVKMGQIVSSQVNVLPDDWAVELDKLQNEVPTFPYAMVRETIIQELGAPPEELYAEFSETPLAAASLAQVHRARLHDGTEVAVKVQRPNLDQQVKADLGVTQTLGRAMENRSQWAREIGLRGMLDEFSANLIEELDYYGEAYNMVRLAGNMAELPGVSVPKLYRELSARRVLTQQFIVGVKISDLEAIDAAGLDRGVLGENALRAAIKMLLIDGFFHADPHPGNLYVDLTNGHVTFLDCGMVGELTVAQRINMLALLWTVVNGDIPAMASQLRSLSEPFRPVDDAKFVKTFEKRMARYGKDSGADFADVFNAGMAVLRDSGLRLDPDLTLAVKAMMQASAFFTPLAPTGADVQLRGPRPGPRAGSGALDGGHGQGDGHQGGQADGDAGRARRSRLRQEPRRLERAVQEGEVHRRGGHDTARWADGADPIDHEHGGHRAARLRWHHRNGHRSNRVRRHLHGTLRHDRVLRLLDHRRSPPGGLPVPIVPWARAALGRARVRHGQPIRLEPCPSPSASSRVWTSMLGVWSRA